MLKRKEKKLGHKPNPIEKRNVKNVVQIKQVFGLVAKISFFLCSRMIIQIISIFIFKKNYAKSSKMYIIVNNNNIEICHTIHQIS